VEHHNLDNLREVLRLPDQDSHREVGLILDIHQLVVELNLDNHQVVEQIRDTLLEVEQIRDNLLEVEQSRDNLLKVEQSQDNLLLALDNRHQDNLTFCL